MAISKKIFEALTATIKMNDTIAHLAEEVKSLAQEVRELDRRLIRLETFIEIAEKHQRLSNLN